MNISVLFPSSSVQEFYHYGGTGGFGTPFVTPKLKFIMKLHLQRVQL
jgi:hypothetical protein